MGENSLIPYADVKAMSIALANGKLFGKTAEQLLPLMLIAQAEGMHPAIAAMEYDIIQGKPAIKSQAALARFQAAGGKIEWVERSDIKCTAIFHHPSCVKPVTVEWTIEKAKRMGLSEKDNWRKQPGIMLQWRVVAEGVRACFPSCLSRMYLVEEVQDFDIPQSEQRNVTPTQETSMAASIELSPADEAKSIEAEIGRLASLINADAVTSARESCKTIRDMTNSDAITMEQAIEKLKVLKNQMAGEVADKGVL